MYSSDIKSLFTAISLNETIDTCAQTLFDINEAEPSLTKESFVKLLHLATTSVELGANGQMYQQLSVVAIGSPLEPTLVNIFVASQEALLLMKRTCRPLYYCRHVDNCFAVFKMKEESVKFHRHLNQLHSALQFTFENEGKT